MKNFFIALIFLLIPMSNAFSRVIEVGENKEYKNLHNVFKHVQSGDTVLIHTGSYVTNSKLELKNKRNVTIKGIGKVDIVCTDISAIILHISHCTNIKITNLNLRHSTMPGQTVQCRGDVVYIFKSNIISITHCGLAGCGYNGVYASLSSFINISENYIHNNANAGINFWNCKNVKIILNRFKNNPADIVLKKCHNVIKAKNEFIKVPVIDKTVHIKPDMEEQRVLDIFNNIKRGSKIIVHAGKYYFNKTVTMMYKKEIQIIGRGKVEFIQKLPEKRVMFINHGINVSVENIRMRHQESHNGRVICIGSVLNVMNSAKIRIINCVLNGCGSIGLYCSHSHKIILEKSSVFNNSSCGITLSRCGTVILKENKIYNNKRSLCIYNVKNLELKNNVIKDNK